MLIRLVAIGLVIAGVLAATVPAEGSQYGDQSACNAGDKASDPLRKIDFYSRCLRFAPLDGETASVIFIKRGVAYTQIGDLDKALQDFTSAIKFDPEEPASYSDRAAIERTKGRYAETIADLEQAHHFRPSDSDMANRLAWELATSPDPSSRDGKKAMAVAREALKLRDDSQVHDTLAAAYAETGQFEEARREEQKSIDLYKGPESVANLQARLELYRKGEAFHMPPVARSASTN